MKMKLDNTRNYSEEALSLRQNVLGWLETMRLPETPGFIYRLNNGADPSVYASCFAILSKASLDMKLWQKNAPPFCVFLPCKKKRQKKRK